MIYRVRVNVIYNTTFNNKSAISGRSVLLLEETGVQGEIMRYTISMKSDIPIYHIKTIISVFDILTVLNS